jgi:hypothetical protein
MKSLGSYIAPVVGITTLMICDAAFILLNYKWSSISPASVFFIIVYNVLVLMALFSHMIAMWSDPGKVKT